MHAELSLKQIQKEWHGTLRSYGIGFISSLILTIASFLLVSAQILPPLPLAYTITFLALVQAVLQLLFFLHLGKEPSPRWETIVFYFMVLVLLIIVLGSFWILFDLEERVMSTMTMEMTHD